MSKNLVNLIEEFEKKFGITKCPDGPMNEKLGINHGKTAKNKARNNRTILAVRHYATY